MVNVELRHFKTINKIGGIFQRNGKWYWADIVELPGRHNEFPYEFMVFTADEHGNITDWAGEYVMRPDAVTEENLMKCIEAFCKDQTSKVDPETLN